MRVGSGKGTVAFGGVGDGGPCGSLRPDGEWRCLPSVWTGVSSLARSTCPWLAVLSCDGASAAGARRVQSGRTQSEPPPGLELAYGAAITSEWAFSWRSASLPTSVAVRPRSEFSASCGCFLLHWRRLSRRRSPTATSGSARWSRSRCSAAALAAATGLFYFGRNEAAIFAFAAAHAVVSTLCRPRLRRCCPRLAATPQQLVAANGVSSRSKVSERLRVPDRRRGDRDVRRRRRLRVRGRRLCCGRAVAGDDPCRRPLAIRDHRAAGDLTAGFRLLARESHPRLIVALFVAQTIVRGALNVLIVVIVFRLLHVGGGWVGFLSGAVGAGMLVGGFASMALAGRKLAVPFGVGLLLWGSRLRWSRRSLIACQLCFCCWSWVWGTRSRMSPAKRSCSAWSATTFSAGCSV